MPLTRTDLQQLASVRITEANALLAANLWDGAYYLAGYAVECALKACIMVHVERTGVIFEDKKFSEKCWTHDIDTLMTLGGLKPAWDADVAADGVLDDNWTIAQDWDETGRYRRTSEIEARELYDAITDPTHGVLPWIKRHW